MILNGTSLDVSAPLMVLRRSSFLLSGTVAANAEPDENVREWPNVVAVGLAGLDDAGSLIERRCSAPGVSTMRLRILSI